MNPRPIFNRYKRHRFPAEIISHCVWLYFRFCLSYRDVEELMAERGVILTYEAVRYWCRKFGQVYANQLRRRHPRPGEKWHLEAVHRLAGVRGQRSVVARNGGNLRAGRCQDARNVRLFRPCSDRLTRGQTPRGWGGPCPHAPPRGLP